MSLLPWDNWIYHLSDKRAEVNSLHTRAVNLQDQIQSQVLIFNGHLKDYKSLIAANSALVIIANAIQMDDLKWKDFQVQLRAIPNPPQGSIPLQVGQTIAEMVGGALILRGIYQVGKIAKDFIRSGERAEQAANVGQDAAIELQEVGVEAGINAGAENGAELGAEEVGDAVGEEAAEAAIEGASLDALASTGIAIFAAVGIDVVFGAIDGAKERDQLNGAIDRLKSALNKCQIYYNTITSKMARIDGGIVNEEKRFQGIIGDLAAIAQHQPNFKYDYPPTVANAAQFLAAQHAALAQYGTYMRFRQSWDLAVSRNPNVTKAEFINNFLMFAPPDVTETTLNSYWNVLAKYSDRLRNAG